MSWPSHRARSNPSYVMRRIPFELEIVGKGAFGTVYKARWRQNFVAVKYIEREGDTFAIEVRRSYLS